MSHGRGGGGGLGPRDTIFEPTPVNDSSVTTTCNRNGAYDLEWNGGGGGRGVGLVNSYTLGDEGYQGGSMYERFEIEEPYMGGRGGGAGGAMVATAGGGVVAAHIHDIRPKSVLKNSIKAIKTGLKSSTNWIPNMIQRATSATPKSGKSKSKSKNSLALNETLSSSSGYYTSSVFSSENSNYATSTFSKEGNNSAVASGNSNASALGGGCATMVAPREPMPTYQQQQQQQKPKQLPAHLSSNNNMVIQPQSMSLATDHYGFMPPPTTPRLPPVTPVSASMVVSSNTNHRPASTSVARNNVNTHVVKVEIHDTTVTAPSPLDSMSNLILPDDMVKYLNENKPTPGVSSGNTNPVTGRTVESVEDVPLGSPMVMSPPQHAPSISIPSPMVMSPPQHTPSVSISSPRDATINSVPVVPAPPQPQPPVAAPTAAATVGPTMSEQLTADSNTITTPGGAINHQTMKWSDTNNNTMPPTSSSTTTAGYNQTASFYQADGTANGTATVGTNYIDNTSINYANPNGGNANWHAFPNGECDDYTLSRVDIDSLTFVCACRQSKLFDGEWLQRQQPSGHPSGQLPVVTATTTEQPGSVRDTDTDELCLRRQQHTGDVPPRRTVQHLCWGLFTEQ